MSTSQTTFPETQPALRARYRAMIANLFFGPVEAVPLRHTQNRLNFRRRDNGKVVSFARADVGESVFVEYFS